MVGTAHIDSLISILSNNGYDQHFTRIFILDSKRFGKTLMRNIKEDYPMVKLQYRKIYSSFISNNYMMINMFLPEINFKKNLF